MPAPTSGYLLIADITGYTAYLNASELEHAQDTLTELLELLVSHTRPPLILSRLAGDAVISYGLAEGFLGGQTFIETLEDTYVAFRQAIERMVMNNTCRCKACANVAGLDLKFFVHYGTFGLQKLSAHDELVGSDVNLLHRLLKNHVWEETGVRAYTLYTDAALGHLALDDFREQLIPHDESYEHLGRVQTWVQDMHPVWERRRQTGQIVIPPDQVALQVETEIAMPPHLVWDYLVHPEFRKTLIGSDSQRILHRSAGRVAPGSAYQCFHGKRIVLQTILEWEPFEYMITDDQAFPGVNLLEVYRLSPTAAGTRLTQTFGKPRGPFLRRALVSLVMWLEAKKAQEDINAFRAHIELDLARRGGLPAEMTVPPAEIRAAVVEGLSPASGAG